MKNKASLFYIIATEISNSKSLYQSLNLAKTIHTQLSKELLKGNVLIVSENTSETHRHK